MTKKARSIPAAVLLALALSAGSADATYSIVARDPETGRLGVAVQSHWFQVGPVVPWARAGVGAVATQSLVKIDYGPEGLDLLSKGLPPNLALKALLGRDPESAVRQVAMVDSQGRVAAWTGERCIAEAGHHTGDGYSVQANLMEKDTVWHAMSHAYEEAGGDFPSRLLLALEAAQQEGGDIRGRQSAAILIVEAESTGKPWQDVYLDLRVDDAPRPLRELRRLLKLHRAYVKMNKGDDAVAEGNFKLASEHYSGAVELAPEIVELPFWQAVTLFTSGRETRALAIFKDVFAREERWIEVARRLPASGLLPEDPKQLRKILAQAPGGAGNVGKEPRRLGQPLIKDSDSVTVEGRLTGEGVECQALRARGGKLYTLMGDLAGFETGDSVRIQGLPQRISICQQGTTLKIVKIERR